MKKKLLLRVPAALLAANINAYSTEGSERKKAFHRTARLFMKDLAAALELPKGTFEIRSNEAGMAVSGEVTLHADHLYVQASESCLKPGIELLNRSCVSRKDYTGGRNHFTFMKDLADDEAAQSRFIDHCRGLIEEGHRTAQYRRVS